MTSIDPDLQVARDRFVVPFYLKMLHGNFLRLPESEREAWLASLRMAAVEVDEETATRLLETMEWRGRLAVSWLIGMNAWHQFTEDMAARLLRSELVYCGQGLCVGLSLLRTEAAAQTLCDYLDRWLPETDCRYDQHWALAALLEIDRHRGTSLAAGYMRTDGLWEQWIGDGSFGLAPVSTIVDLLGEGGESRTSGTQD